MTEQRYRGYTLEADRGTGCIVTRDSDGLVIWSTVALDEVATTERGAIVYMQGVVNRRIEKGY